MIQHQLQLTPCWWYDHGGGKSVNILLKDLQPGALSVGSDFYLLSGTSRVIAKVTRRSDFEDDLQGSVSLYSEGYTFYIWTDPVLMLGCYQEMMKDLVQDKSYTIWRNAEMKALLGINRT